MGEGFLIKTLSPRVGSPCWAMQTYFKGVGGSAGGFGCADPGCMCPGWSFLL